MIKGVIFIIGLLVGLLIYTFIFSVVYESGKVCSGKKYKEALEDCDKYKRRSEAKSSEAWFVLQDLMQYREENIKLSEQVAEYKQKYLDEQQKRLELAELVERMESVVECDVKIEV